MTQMAFNGGAGLRSAVEDARETGNEAGWLARALWHLEAKWSPLADLGGSLCFVIDECAEVASSFSADLRQGEQAAP